MESIGVDVGVAGSLARLALIEAVLGQSERAPAVQMLADGGVHHPNVFRVHGDLVEALVRAGRRGRSAARRARACPAPAAAPTRS